MSNDAPYMRWFVDDYLGDTGHLTCLEHGAYTQILWAMWKRGGSIPERHIPRLVGITPDEWSDSRDTLAEFFVVDGGTWTHERIREEIDAVEAKRQASVKAGKASARLRRKAKTKPEPGAPEATKPERPFNERSTDAQRPLNGCSTERQRPMNHGDGEVDVDVPPTDSTFGFIRGGDAREAPADRSPPEPADYLRLLIDRHGCDERQVRFNRGSVAQAQAWHGDGVTLAELDAAASIVRSKLDAKSDSAPPPVAFIARIVKQNRAPTEIVSAGPPPESSHDRANRLAREMGQPTLEELDERDRRAALEVTS